MYTNEVEFTFNTFIATYKYLFQNHFFLDVKHLSHTNTLFLRILIISLRFASSSVDIKPPKFHLLNIFRALK